MVPGTGLEPASQSRRRIFVTLLLSKPAPRGAVRALDYAFAVARERCCRSCALGAPRLVSTPSPPPLSRPLRAWLGVASAHRAPGVSPNLKGSAPAVSGRALNRLSPLCLPISSPRQGRTAFYHRCALPNTLSPLDSLARGGPSAHRSSPRFASNPPPPTHQRRRSIARRTALPLRHQFFIDAADNPDDENVYTHPPHAS